MNEFKNIDDRIKVISSTPRQLVLDLDQSAARMPQRLERIESLFEPVTADNASLNGLALVTLPEGTVRLTANGRDFYRQSCQLVGISPSQVRTLDQLQVLRQIDAELMLQRLMDVELAQVEGLLCI